jgi:hypothetical protein
MFSKIIHGATTALGLAPPPPSQTVLAAALFEVDISGLDLEKPEDLLEALERIAQAARPAWTEPYVHKGEGRLPPHMRRLHNGLNGGGSS